jgi:hypothetical protein
MVHWCRDRLAPHAPEFEFLHHDVGNPSFNPGVGEVHAIRQAFKVPNA